MRSKHFKRFQMTSALGVFTLAAVLAAVLGGAEGALHPVQAQATAGNPVSCPFSRIQGASIFDGFYVIGYTGNNLGKVTLGYGTTGAAPYELSLTARRNSYDGPQIGTTQTAIVDLPASGEAFVTFDFGGAPVTPGDTITFTQTASSLGTISGEVFYDQGDVTCANLFETQGTPPPLGSISRQGVGITISQYAVSTFACVPSDTVLCIDNLPGDHRFQVTATFNTSQGGGRSGNAQAIPLSSLGVTRGGLFWFFGADNPEVLFKLINGCGANNNFWAFVAADTNVGYSLTVTDTILANKSRTYTNLDNTPATPVQDTTALSSCGTCATSSDCRSGLLCCFTPSGNACLAPIFSGGCPLIP